MNELYKKINHYVYEIRMIEFDEYLYGMNSQKIDEEKAYDIICDAPNSESNAVINFLKASFADLLYLSCKSSRVEENQSISKAFYQKALELDIEGMAEAGDKYAQACLGEMYYYGRGVDENYSTAVKWYRKAAEQGHATAQYHLGYMYYNGRGVDENNSTTVEWYRKAAEQGHAIAQYHLGWMYQCGNGVDENNSTAVELYRKAAEQGYAHAQHILGDMYQNGDGVKKNYSTAVKWFRKAAEQGDADAQNDLDRLTESLRKKRTHRGVKKYFLNNIKNRN